MTVRVWLTPSALGESGYSIDFTQADDYHRHKTGALVLTFEDAHGDTFECARVQAERWDAAELLPEKVRR